MAARERRKGKVAENEVCRILRAAGWPDAERTSNGRHQSGRGDVANGPPGFHLEVRRRERAELWAWLADAERDAVDGDVPAVVFRRSRSRWYAALPLDALLALLATSKDGG